MKTFYIETLGCKVNHYESEQLATLLRARGLVRTDAAHADLRVVNTCSVTLGAAGKSRQSVRRTIRLPLFSAAGDDRAARETAGPGTGQTAYEDRDHVGPG